MSWFDLTREEREEWRKHPSTLAYFAELRSQTKDVKDSVVSALTADDVDSERYARRLAGKVDGLETAVNIMEAERGT